VETEVLKVFVFYCQRDKLTQYDPRRSLEVRTVTSALVQKCFFKGKEEHQVVMI